MAALSPDVILVLFAAFGAGFIDSMAGGGGLIQVPVLFATYPDVPPPTLLGTSKFAGIFGVVSAVVRYSRRVEIPWRSLLPLAAVVLLASLGGAKLATIVAPEV